MKTLEELNRFRSQKLYLLLPEEIAKKHISPFFITGYEPSVNMEAITLDKYQYLIDDLRNTLRSHGRRALANVVKANKIMTTGKTKERLRVESIDSARTRKASRDMDQPVSAVRQSVGSVKVPSILKNSSISKSVGSEKSVAHEKSIPIKFDPSSPKTTALYSKGCISCGKSNIKVRYYLERHMCLECRSYLKTPQKEPAFLFLNDKDDIECYAKVGEDSSGKPKYRKANPADLRFNDMKCYATYAGADEMIVLFHSKQKTH